MRETWQVIIVLPLPSARSFAPAELGPPWGAALEERCREQKRGLARRQRCLGVGKKGVQAG